MSDRVVSTELAATRTLVNRLTSVEIAQLLKEWSTNHNYLPHSYKVLQQQNQADTGSYVDEPHVDYEALAAQPKSHCVELLLAEYPDGLLVSQVAQLDFKYVKQVEDALMWKALKIIRDKEEWDELTIWQKDTIQRNISAKLSIYLEQYCHVEWINNNLWIQLLILDNVPLNEPPPASNIIYFIFIPQTDYLLYSDVKKRHMEIIQEILIQTLCCNELQEHPLMDRHYNSLIELLTNANVLGSGSKYRSEYLDEHPLSHFTNWTTSRNTRNVIAMSETTLEDAELQQRQLIANMQLGSEPLPTLSQVHYEVAFNLQTASAPNIPSISTTSMRVKFEGPHVLEGFRELILSDIGHPPLPKHITRIPSLAMNIISMDLTESNLSTYPC
ncbi:centromere protein Chl4/mis15/CENP-N [Syncephalis plumigaleata]|nr:centromere protein Chl4/mis15/CENP-N [Syncephalis plumigaleata]